MSRHSAVIPGGLLALSVAIGVAGTLMALAGGGGAHLPMWLMLGFSVVGAVLAAKAPSNPAGWLLLAEGILWQVNLGAGDLRALQPAGSSGAVKTASAWVYEVLWIAPLMILPLLFLLFPSGRLPSPRWRPALVALGASGVLLFASLGLRAGPFADSPATDNPLGIRALDPLQGLFEAGGNLLFAATFVAALVSLVVRYRSTDSVTRQQIKWLALALGVIVLAWTSANVVEAVGAVGDAGAVRIASLLLIPPAFAVAVLRYRLYDIDLVVSRLFVYAGLAALVVMLYVVVVAGIGTLVGTAGRPNLVLSVLATTAAALAFDPARRALQRAASRAVYGRRASPYEALVSMTSQVSGGYLASEILADMARSIADATGGRAEVWVATGQSLQRWACWPQRPGDDPAQVPAPVPLTELCRIAGPDGTFPVRHGGEVLGALSVTKPRGESIRPAEHRLLSHLAASASLVLQNVRLVTELRASRQRLVAAQDAERRRVERDLHDGAQQRLLALSIALHRAQRQALQAGADEAAGTLADARRQMQEALQELRDLARGIHPAILTEQGLAAAVESLADRLPIPVELDVAVGVRLDPPLESTSYFVASEAMANIVKHAGVARARISIRLEGGSLEVEVSDDGAGGADPEGNGLRGLADRVAALGGQFAVKSAPGCGTRVSAVLPCE